MNYSPEQLEEKFKTLPADLQELLLSEKLPNTIDEIGVANGLTKEQNAELSDETGLVIFGFTNPAQFIPNLRFRLTVPPEKAKKIADTINDAIFKQVRISLLKIHNINPAIVPTPPTNSAVKPFPVTTTPPVVKAPVMTQLVPPINKPISSPLSPKPPVQPPVSPVKPIQPAQTVTAQPIIKRQPETHPDRILETTPVWPEIEPKNKKLTSTNEYVPPPTPVKPMQTLEQDIKKEASIMAQKLSSATTLPKQDVKIEIPDPKNRTTDLYREAI